MRRAIIAGATSIVAATIALLSGLFTDHSSAGLVAALVVLVAAGGVLAAMAAKSDSFGSEPAEVGGSGGLGPFSVPVAAAIQDPSPIFETVDLENFTGRTWITDDISAFKANNSSGYIWIEADAGVGKTTFAAWMVKENNYLSHFPGYTGDNSANAALRNLSAQLISRYGLDEFAHGKTLPDWAFTSDGFLSLLEKAAPRAKAASGLILVVDNLDEAEPAGDAMPYGLPRHLPAGVFVIGTFRTGWAPRFPEAPVITLRIDKDDPRNRSDIREFLARVVKEKWLASQLTSSSLNQADFVDLIAARCGGVWVYLRYVLRELRDGLRQPDSLQDLPSGLWSYYTDQVVGWRSMDCWANVLRPLLATLAVTAEPLPADTLAWMAGGLDAQVTSHWCALHLRALLTTRATADMQTRYAIYHSSFREVLLGKRPSPLDGIFPDQLVSQANLLGQAATAAHGRIADLYLNQRFGGLPGGLDLLAEQLDLASAEDGYPLRNLTRHLLLARRPADLRLLLTAQHVTAKGRTINVWFAAHDHAEQVTSYLEDIGRAAANCANATEAALNAHKLAVTAGEEIRYLLIKASITNQASNLTIDLLELALNTRSWSVQRGLDHSRRISDPLARCEALSAVYPHLSSDQQVDLATEILSTAESIPDDKSREDTLDRLAVLLPFHLGIHGRRTASPAVAAAPATPVSPAASRPTVTAQTLSDARAIADDDARAWALIGLVPYVPTDEQSEVARQALDAARKIGGARSRASALTRLVPQLPLAQQREIVAEALNTATTIGSDSAYVAALTGLAPYLPAEQQAYVVDHALAAATAITDGVSRAEALVLLAQQLPAELMPQALAAASAIKDTDAAATAAVGLAPRLSPDLISHALTIARGLRSDRRRAPAIAAIARFLQPNERIQTAAEALAIAGAATGTWTCADALTGMAPYIPPDLLAEALAIATAIPDENARADSITGLAPYLPTALLPEALNAAGTITSKNSRATAIAGIAPLLPTDLVPRAIAVADSGEIPSGNVALIPSADQWIDALVATNRIESDITRASLLTAITPFLSESLLDQAINIAIGVTSESALPVALAAIAPRRPSEVWASAMVMADRYGRASVLASAAPYLPPAEHDQAFGNILKEIEELSNDSLRADILRQLIPHLPQELLGQAFAATSTQADILIAIMKRAADISPDGPAIFMGLLRASLDTAARDTSLTVIGAIAPEIDRLGGPAAISECARSVIDVHRWWP